MKNNVLNMTAVLVLCLAVLLSGCAKKEEPKTDSGLAQVVNPLVTVDSVAEMEERLGYTVPALEKEVSSYIVLVINGAAESGRIRYEDGSDFNIKKGSGDISGIYGGTVKEEKTVGGVRVSFLAYEEIRYAIWEKDGFAFSLTGSDALEDEVAALIGA